MDRQSNSSVNQMETPRHEAKKHKRRSILLHRTLSGLSMRSSHSDKVEEPSLAREWFPKFTTVAAAAAAAGGGGGGKHNNTNAAGSNSNSRRSSIFRRMSTMGQGHNSDDNAISKRHTHRIPSAMATSQTTPSSPAHKPLSINTSRRSSVTSKNFKEDTHSDEWSQESRAAAAGPDNTRNRKPSLQNGLFNLDTNLEDISDITKVIPPPRQKRGSGIEPLSTVTNDGPKDNQQPVSTAKITTPIAKRYQGDDPNVGTFSWTNLHLSQQDPLAPVNRSNTSTSSQQWTAPENWDVESVIEKSKSNANRSNRKNSLIPNRRTKSQVDITEMSNKESYPPDTIIDITNKEKSTTHTGNKIQSAKNALTFDSSAETESISSGFESSSYYSSDDENYGASEGEIQTGLAMSAKQRDNNHKEQNFSSVNPHDDTNNTVFNLDDERHDKAEYELEKYYKDFSDLSPNRHYAIRIFNVDDTFTTLSCTPGTTVQEMIPTLRRKFNTSNQGNYQISLKVGKLSKILKPLSKPILIERKLLLLNGYKKTDPLHIMGIEDLSFVFKFHFHPVALSHLTLEQEQRLMRSDFVHVDLRRMDLTTPPIIFYQHTAEIESLDVSNNANIFLPSEFIESALNLSSLRMVNIRASRFPANITDAYKLVSLELQRNFIRKVPNSISKLSNLTILNLQCNGLEKLPRGFSKLKNLQLLDLSSNKFVHYPTVINHCTNLLQVDLSYNKIHTLPESINRLIKLAKMNLSHNRLTYIGDLSSMKSLRTLNLRHNRITSIKTNASNLQTLFLTGNRISTFDDTLPRLRTLEIPENPITSIPYKGFYPMNMTSLSLNKAKLASIPGDLFDKLSRLEKLDLSENNLTQLPQEISYLSRLIYLSVARNKLESLPSEFWRLKGLKTLDLHSNNIREFVPGTEDIELTYLNVSSNAFEDVHINNPFYQTISSESKLCKSLMLFLAADNQFDDKSWSFFSMFKNLKLLNLSYNNFKDVSSLKLENLTDLYLSGNQLSTLSGDTVLKWKSLKILMLNGNQLVSLPAELSQLSQLTVFDVGSNQLKYNISNFHYEWNWSSNKELRYLNFSGNRRFEIKSNTNPDTNEDLSDLTNLPQLKVLGLMDVTLNTSKVPDESFNFRLRTTGSIINGMLYGVADTLGQRVYVSTRDVTFERFRGKDDECLLCLHDSKNQSADYGHNISRIVRDIYDRILRRQLEKYGEDDDGIKNALRFSFLQLNKEINIMLNSVDNGGKVANLTSADLLSGACSTVIYIKGNKLYSANIGDCMAILSKNNGDYTELTTLHVPYRREEYERIRISGGYVNNDKLDGDVDVSRAVGFFDLLPHIHASPDISVVTLTKADEMLIIATNKLWEYMDYETACDIARQNSLHPMLAAAEMKDHAIAYGCSDSITILCLSLFKSEEHHNQFTLNKSSLMTRRTTFEDTTLRRLQPEISPPTGNLAMVFTDIKNSTFLWELFPNAMRSAIKTHNDIMRRQLRIYGGYEVKTEGDAFMVAFPTPINSLVWCLSVQLKLLDAEWPEEITSIQDGCTVTDKDGTKIYQGLSVRMGIHWGCPVPELDVVTQRMDYLGPVVNKAARVSSVADGGQITLSSDFCSEFNKIMEYHHMVVDKKESLKDAYGEEFVGEILEREIAMLEDIGWILFDYGEQKLKGLETKEYITIAYPKSLESRHEFVVQEEEGRVVNSDILFRLRAVSNKLDTALSAVSGGFIDFDMKTNTSTGFVQLNEKAQEVIMGTISELDVLMFLDHLITRIESSVALLQLRQRVNRGLTICKPSETNQKNVFEILDELTELVNIPMCYENNERAT